jgi:hypothetical protein
MKKNFLYLVAAVAITAVAVWNVSQSKNETALTGVALENVEALADSESGASCQWASRETWQGWEAICIVTGVGYDCPCGSVKTYYYFFFRCGEST